METLEKLCDIIHNQNSKLRNKDYSVEEIEFLKRQVDYLNKLLILELGEKNNAIL